MNDKIKELIKSLGIIPEDEHYEIAQLIIQECIEVCLSRAGNSDYNTGRTHCISDIKEHFGVK